MMDYWMDFNCRCFILRTLVAGFGVGLLILTLLLKPVPGQAESLTLQAYFILGTPRPMVAAFPMQGAQTTTLTQTATASWTTTATGTLSLSETPTPTGSTTPSLTPTNTSTVGNIKTNTPTVSATSTVPLFTTAILSPLPDMTPGMLDTPTVITATATFKPLPVFTYQYPQISRSATLSAIEHPPGSLPLRKGRVQPVWEKLKPLWPLAIVFAVWLVLAAWFVLAQRL